MELGGFPTSFAFMPTFLICRRNMSSHRGGKPLPVANSFQFHSRPPVDKGSGNVNGLNREN